jgi:hypothetical protein
VRVRPDDDVYRVDAVWLGPKGLTLPWQARYHAYAIWLVLFVGVLTVEAVLPMDVSLPPVWELCFTVLATFALMGLVDHERSVASLWQVLRAEVTAPRAARPAPVRRLDLAAVRVAGSRRGGSRDGDPTGARRHPEGVDAATS